MKSTLKFKAFGRRAFTAGFGIALGAIMTPRSAAQSSTLKPSPAWEGSPRSRAAIEKWTPLLAAAFKAKGLDPNAAVFLRLVKTSGPDDRQGYLESFVETRGGAFRFFKRWPICTYSGTLGPKLKEGDEQAPEGFYFVKPNAMNPFSDHHLSFNLGFPNQYDRAHGRTGSFLMIHGGCSSIGCYAMTDEVIGEVYSLMSAAFKGGQAFIRVHLFPFPMTRENLNAHADNENYAFWKNLKAGWDRFEHYRRPPNVVVEQNEYRFTDGPT